jgi:hypothetical protein
MNGTIREGFKEERCERDASKEAWYAPLWQGRQRWQGEEPETGYCHWPFGSAQEGSKSPEEKIELKAHCCIAPRCLGQIPAASLTRCLGLQFPPTI